MGQNYVYFKGFQLNDFFFSGFGEERKKSTLAVQVHQEIMELTFKSPRWVISSPIAMVVAKVSKFLVIVSSKSAPATLTTALS